METLILSVALSMPLLFISLSQFTYLIPSFNNPLFYTDSVSVINKKFPKTGTKERQSLLASLVILFN